MYIKKYFKISDFIAPSRASKTYKGSRGKQSNFLYFKILFLLIFLFLYTGCRDNKRLNPNDPLSPYYEQPVIMIISNINVTLNYSNTTIIDEDTTWKAIYSPIKIIQNVLVTDGAVLTIEAGTKIEFYAIGSGHVGIIVENYGALNAIGEITKPIKFYAIDGAFSYIVFRYNCLDSKCVLKYCDLNQIFVYCINTGPAITIQKNKIMDISLFSTDSTIQFNDITTLLCNDSSPVIKNNLFPFSASFKRNILIEGNSIPEINNNNILGGKNYCIENLSSFTQNAINNYWGTTSTNGITNEINVKIYDRTDGTNNGPVRYKPFYTNEISGAGAGW